MSNLESHVATFEADVETTHDIVHGDDTTEVATDNGPVRSFAKLQKDLVEDLNAADTIAETQQHRDEAQQFRDQAEAARDAATLAGEVYADTAAGLAAVGDGEYFKTPADDEEGFLTLWQRQDAGTAQPIDTYPSLAGLDARLETLNGQLVALIQSLGVAPELGTLRLEFTRQSYLIGSA